MKTVEYLDPGKKLVDAVTEWLCEGGRIRLTPEGARSLSHIMVVTPTAQSGRNLRLRLAEEAHKRGWGGVLPPKIAMANVLLTLPEARVGTEAEELATMATVLLDADMGKYGALFPNPPAERSVEWALSTAEMLLSVGRVLGEKALMMAEVRAELDAGRWRDLSEVEAAFVAELKARGVVPRCLARKQAAAGGCREPGIEEIVLPSSVDVQDAFIEYLGNSGQRVSVLVHARSEDAGKFDDWGRPTAAFAAELGPEMIDSSPNTVTEADDIAKYFRAVKADEELPALVVCDSEMYPELDGAFQNHFSEEELALRNPFRERLSGSSLGRLLETAFALSMNGDYETFSTLIRTGDVARWARSELKVTAADIAEYTGALDAVQNRHLPRTIDEVIAGAETELDRARCERDRRSMRGLSDMTRLIKAGIADPFEFIRRIFATVTLDERISSDRELIAAAEVVRELREECGSEIIQSRFRDRLFLRLMKSAAFVLEPMAKNVLATTGWLELQWCPEDEVVIAGFNEGCVPENTAGHPFLPDSLREELGLSCNERRGFRDSFIFAEAVACRAKGAVSVHLHQLTGDKNAVKPSRILFDGISDGELPALALRLYAVTNGSDGTPPKEMPSAWRLKLPIPPRETIFRESISVTALNQYLRCPFNFYLQEIFGQHADDRNQELSPTEFGSLCHSVLDKFAQNGPKDSTDEREIAEFLTEEVRRQLRGFGTALPAIIELQGEAAIARLEAFARLQAARRAAGWRIIAAERSFECRIKSCPTILKGKIDRIDRHEGTGELAIIDYKTWSRARSEGDADLQLPMYRAMVEASGLYEPDAAHSSKALYCVLAERAEDVVFDERHAWHEGMQSAAEDRAVQLLTDIARGVFYPPKKEATGGRYVWQSQFGTLIWETPEQGVAPEWIADQVSRTEAP